MKQATKVSFLLLIFDATGFIFLYLITSTNIRNDLPAADVNRKYNGDDSNTSDVVKRGLSSDFVSPDDNSLLYSAYEGDYKGTRVVRIIGVAKNRNRSSLDDTFWCYFLYTNTSITRIVEGFIENIPEDHDLNYTAAYFICPLQSTSSPDAVAVTFDNKTGQLEYLTVRNTKLGNPLTFTVCTSPMHSGYNDSSQLLEWVELNMILGVQKFNTYVNNVSDEVLKILKYYEYKGVIEILPWSIPQRFCIFDDNSSLLHSCGQLVALNDCLYRTKGRSQFISVLDLDELIIPQNKDDVTWSDMMERFPVASGFLLLSSFFSASTQKERDKYFQTGLRSMSYLTRDNVVFIGRVRSKVIARTDKAVTLGVHHVWSFTSGRERGIEPSVGLLHHYRDTLIEYPQNIHVNRFKSNTTLKYFTKLQENVLKTRTKIGAR